MTGMFVIARFSFLELLRGKIFWVILIFALVISCIISYGGYYTVSKSPLAEDIQREQLQAFSQMENSSPHEFQLDPLFKDLPLSISKMILRWLDYIIYIFFGNFLAIFGAIGMLANELENRSIYTLISKPLSRTDIFFGKLCGLILALLFYAVSYLVAGQIFFMLAGAGWQPSLFIAAGIGFINFLIFGIFALLLSIKVRPILAGVLSIILLWSSTHGGVQGIKLIGKEVLRFGDWIDYIILLLPSQKSIGNYAISFMLDKYNKSFTEMIPREILELVSDDPRVMIQPLIWLGAVLILGYLAFFRKEFD